MILSFIFKVTNGTKSLALFTSNVDPVVCIATMSRTDGLASGSATTLAVIDISDNIHFSDHDKSCSILQ